MGLREQLEEDKKALAELMEQEVKEETPAEEPEVKEEQPEEKVEEPKAEEVKEEPPVKTPADYAAERRENKAAAKLAEELSQARARIAALETQQVRQPVQDNDPEPNINEAPAEWAAWKTRKQDEKLAKLESNQQKIDFKTNVDELKIRAKQEIANYEAETRAKHPDYDDVRGYYANMLAASLKIADPDISNQDLVNQVEQKLMFRASKLLNQGFENPTLIMYEEAKRLGYQPRQTEEIKQEIKPDLSKVAQNRARNAGTAGAQGRGDGGQVTLAVAAKMTNREFAKLPTAEKKRILSGG